MPWHLPGDLAHFRSATMGKPVIMGRRTFESIGAPLPGRETIVLSRDPAFRAAGVRTAATMEEAIDKASALGRPQQIPEIMVAGGASVYNAALPSADALLVTAVDLRPAGDTFFPAIDAAHWLMVEHTPARRRADDDADYAFLHYVRQPSIGDLSSAARFRP